MRNELHTLHKLIFTVIVVLVARVSLDFSYFGENFHCGRDKKQTGDIGSIYTIFHPTRYTSVIGRVCGYESVAAAYHHKRSGQIDYLLARGKYLTQIYARRTSGVMD